MRVLQKGHMILAVINMSVMGACQQETRATITVSTTTEELKEEKAGRRRWHQLEMKQHTTVFHNSLRMLQKKTK